MELTRLDGSFFFRFQSPKAKPRTGSRNPAVELPWQRHRRADRRYRNHVHVLSVSFRVKLVVVDPVTMDDPLAIGHLTRQQQPITVAPMRFQVSFSAATGAQKRFRNL